MGLNLNIVHSETWSEFRHKTLVIDCL